MNRLGRPKFVVKKLQLGLDKPTSEALSELTRAIGGQNEPDAVRYAIRQMARVFQTSETASQKVLSPDGN